jgi:imidazolonepropionase
MTVRLLTNIGRLWTGSEIWSNVAILIRDEHIGWVGAAADLPASVPGVIHDITDVDHVENLGGGLVTPGLIDSHTHPVYAGNRWAELAMRSGGSSGPEITAAGGGVASTVTVTRGTDPWTLCNGVRERLHSWLLSGTTTVEAKTGYHLTRDGELADVRLLRSLEKEPGMPRVHVTFLAANTVPPEFFGRRSDYIDAVGSWCADAAAAGADSIDAYCDDGRFSAREASWVLNAGRSAGLLPRLHACSNGHNGTGQHATGQHSAGQHGTGQHGTGQHAAVQQTTGQQGNGQDPSGALLAAHLGCVSADLLPGASDADVAALAEAGVVAVVCPAGSFNSRRQPPLRALLDRGVPVALASGHSPGGNGITSMPLVISLAVGALGMSVTEALRAATLGGAQALRAPDRGAMARGRLADIVAWDADHEGAFAWSYGLKPIRVWRGGEPVTAE